MAIGKYSPKSLKQLAEDAVAGIISRCSKILTTVVNIKGQDRYICSVDVQVQVNPKNSEVAHRQINEIQVAVKELNEREKIHVDFELDKSAIYKKWSFKRLQRRKKMHFKCRFSFSVEDIDLFTVKNLSQTILINLEELMVHYREDQVRVKFKRGTRTQNETTDNEIELKTNTKEQITDMNKDLDKPSSSRDLDFGLNKHSNDPKFDIKNETGTFNFENKAKTRHFHLFNCCNTGRKDETGCTTGLFDFLKKCACCSKS